MAEHPLNGLDDVDWRSLSHAYGSAEDVPGLLRQFWSGTDSEREASIDALFGNIWHQSTVYEATPYAVPFIVAMAEHEHCPSGRTWLLQLLQSIAAGMNYVDQHSQMASIRLRSGDPELEEQRTRGRQHVAQSRQAVAAGIGAYQLLLDDDNTETRVAAAALLAEFATDRPHLGEVIAVAIGEARDDREAALLATMVLRLAVAVPPVDSCTTAVSNLARLDESSLRDQLLLAFESLKTNESLGAAGALAAEALAAVDPDDHDRLVNLAEIVFPQGSPSIICFHVALFPSDPTLMGIYLERDAASSRAAASEVCEQMALMLEDNDIELSDEAVDRGLLILAATGAAGIQALRAMQEHASDQRIEDTLATAEQRAKSYRSDWLWNEAPDPTWTVEDCIEMIEDRLTVRQQDRSLLLRATLGLIAHGPAAAPADIAHRIANLDSDHYRVVAANLLWAANRDPSQVLPILNQQLEGDELVRTAHLARRMGSHAAPLVPGFRDLLSRDRIRQFGIPSEAAAVDEAIRHALKAAIDAIEADEQTP